MIRENLSWKLLAIAIALVLWVYVNSERYPQSSRTISAPIEIRNLSRGYEAILQQTEAEVTLSGLKTAVDNIQRDDIHVWVDVKGITTTSETSRALKLNYSVRGASKEDIAISVYPSIVNVSIEAIAHKKFPVQVEFAKAPPLGYAHTEPKITPSAVVARGRAKQIAQVKRVVAYIITDQYANAIDDDFEIIPVDSLGNPVADVSLDKDKAHISFKLVQVPATKTVIVSGDIIGQPKFPAKIEKVTIEPSTVVLEGKADALIKVSTVSTEPVDITDSVSTVTKEALLKTPRGVNVVGSKRVKVTVHISNPQQNPE